jgi:hypothetical protein
MIASNQQTAVSRQLSGVSLLLLKARRASSQKRLFWLTVDR